MNERSLISRVLSVVERHEREMELSGEKFNVFSILRLSVREPRTHSAFISELLNPRGTHGCGHQFLSLFVRQMKLRLDCQSAKVSTEKFLGPVSADSEEGGKVDILVTDNEGNMITIENKVYAGDQPKQLVRYWRWGKEHAARLVLLYLTLFGDDPSDDSRGGLKKGRDFFTLSYRVDVLRWLGECRKQVVDKPVLRETIAQYESLLCELTGQSRSKAMSDEIVDLIVSDRGSLRAFFSMSGELESVKRRLFLELIQQLGGASVDDLAFERPDLEKTIRGEESLVFRLPRSAKGYRIGFGFCSYFARMVYGIYCQREYTDEHVNEIARRLGPSIRSTSQWEDWVWVNDFGEGSLGNWADSAPWLAIEDGTMEKCIVEEARRLRDGLRGLRI